MFTGIVEEVGRLEAVRSGGKSMVVTIGAHLVTEGTKVGDSIAVNGVCLTVTELHRGGFLADVMPETMKRTALGSLGPNSLVNLERAMAADGRFGGHLVSGHIDGVGQISAIRKEENAVWYTVSPPKELLRYIVEKGSIAMDGISLTVAEVTKDSFSVSTIPHTRTVTALGEKQVGDKINLECDIIGKYVEKLLFSKQEEKTESRLTRRFLQENGFF